MISEFKIFKPFSGIISHGVTYKMFGSFNDDEKSFETSIKKLMDYFSVNRPVFADQMHDDGVMILSERPNKKPETDAFITNKKGLPLMIKVADCQGIIMFDPETKTIAAVHSGWRGSVKNIIGKTIGKMKEKFGVKPENLLAGISPSLGPCCAEFSDPESELPEFCRPFTKGKKVDFWALSLKQLSDEGVLVKNIENPRICTKCGDDCYSYRRGEDGRMAVFISLKV